MDAVVGLNGLTNNKVEGDKVTCWRIFNIQCFGRYENPGTKLSYTQFNEDEYWVDDMKSSFIIHIRKVL